MDPDPTEFVNDEDQPQTLEAAEASGAKNRLNTLVAITVALLATFMGICKVKDDNIVQAMQQAQADKIDSSEGYADRAGQWLSTGTVLNRLNFANAVATNRIKGTQLRPSRFASGVDLNDARAVTSYLVQSILGGEITPETKAALGKISNDLPENVVQTKVSSATVATAPMGSNSNYPQKAATAINGAAHDPAYLSQVITLIIGAPEFQRR